MDLICYLGYIVNRFLMWMLPTSRVVYREKSKTDPWWCATQAPLVWLLIFKYRTGPWSGLDKNIALDIAKKAYVEYRDIKLDELILYNAEHQNYMRFREGKWCIIFGDTYENVFMCQICRRPSKCPKHIICHNCENINVCKTRCVVCANPLCCGYELMRKTCKFTEWFSTEKYACARCADTNVATDIYVLVFAKSYAFLLFLYGIFTGCVIFFIDTQVTMHLISCFAIYIFLDYISKTRWGTDLVKIKIKK
jgi:hypothetical protein